MTQIVVVLGSLVLLGAAVWLVLARRKSSSASSLEQLDQTNSPETLEVRSL